MVRDGLMTGSKVFHWVLLQIGNKEVVQNEEEARSWVPLRWEILSNGNDSMEIKCLMIWKIKSRMPAAESFEMRNMGPHAQRKRQVNEGSVVISGIGQKGGWMQERVVQWSWQGLSLKVSGGLNFLVKLEAERKKMVVEIFGIWGEGLTWPFRNWTGDRQHVCQAAWMVYRGPWP